RRLSVAGKRDVVQPTQRRRRTLELRMLKQPAAGRQSQCFLQLLQKLPRLNKLRLALRGAIDLAIDAVEVANFVRIEIHPDRNPLAPPAQHRIHEPVLLEPAGMTSVEGGNNHRSQPDTGQQQSRTTYYT